MVDQACFNLLSRVVCAFITRGASRVCRLGQEASEVAHVRLSTRYTVSGSRQRQPSAGSQAVEVVMRRTVARGRQKKRRVAFNSRLSIAPRTLQVWLGPSWIRCYDLYLQSLQYMVHARVEVGKRQ